MEHVETHQPDYGTGQKTLSVYLWGLLICSVLTLFSFGIVMHGSFSKITTFILIFISALVQFVTQVICFLRLNVQTTQSKANVLSLLFTIVVLITIVAGSLWIMWNLDYYMVN